MGTSAVLIKADIACLTRAGNTVFLCHAGDDDILLTYRTADGQERDHLWLNGIPRLFDWLYMVVDAIYGDLEPYSPQTVGYQTHWHTSSGAWLRWQITDNKIVVVRFVPYHDGGSDGNIRQGSVSADELWAFLPKPYGWTTP